MVERHLLGPAELVNTFLNVFNNLLNIRQQASMAWPSLAITIKLGLITHYPKFHNNILNYKLTVEG